ncbi:glucose-1-phosphate cytidylyltransferase [Sphingomonas aracearum]|uniref:Glucose-1-phosphate cytidylyltransferase n=1 Tax=Sphingomonas aracearum TaxID=2283317 RepID=A0A369VW10_9SPHN|nr:glucose-1-phosphate cytidylyltransferase [Sphingomonas aracearum]RDE06293.1 glucose-1-phosphate cytidylyltransferase [Sphingomonas aracearum]
MKAAIFAGGFGTRLSEETAVTPKPMVEIGKRPILWHIMKMYAHWGIRDFVVLGGYRVEYIRSYFANYMSQTCDMTVDLSTGVIEWLSRTGEDWRVTVLDTGLDTMTGGRLKRARHLLDGAPFCLTYGDGVSDVHVPSLVAQHHGSNHLCTLTAVTQPGRYGALRLADEGRRVDGFREKGATDGGLINGGFFVCQPEMIDLIEGDDTVFEAEPMERMVEAGQLGCYVHDGFWQSMDTLRDKHLLESLWSAPNPPWKIWEDRVSGTVTSLRKTA